jgi:integrase
VSAFQDKHGQWWAQIDSGYLAKSGGRKYTRRKATGEKDAQRLERRLLRERDAGTLLDTREPSVKKWAEDWLKHQATRVRPKTFDGYSTAIRRYVIPTIGQHKLSQLTPAHIRKVADAVRADGSTSTTVRDHQTRLQKCLKDALRDGYKVPASVLTVDLPARSVTDRTSIPTDQVAAVLAVIAKRDDRSRWMAALLHGMRQGEALGLTWQCGHPP